MPDAPQATLELLKFVHNSPTPYHCVEQAKTMLCSAGFSLLDEREAWSVAQGGAYCVQRDGALVAFCVGDAPVEQAGFRLIGAHTDSPNLRVKPQPSVQRGGFGQLGVEVYGGALTYTWLDRDLGLAGRVVLRREGASAGVEHALVWIDRPILRIPSLAIHLFRELKEEGLKLNPQEHLQPVWALVEANAAADKAPKELLRECLAAQLSVDPQRILSWDLMLVDVVPPTTGGLHGDMIFSPRLDNQAMCHAALFALLAAHKGGKNAATPVVVLYDHEEVGSESASGAAGALMTSILQRLVKDGGAPQNFARAIANSFQISADMAHAVHPNYQDRHEPQHWPQLNRGPVIKLNANQRYATGAEGAGLFESLCQDADVPYQKFVNRTDLACGSTIGPISAARLGVRTVDVGNPMLSMHSIREQAGAFDHERMIVVMQRFLGLERC